MIASKCFTKEWIQTKQKELKPVDPLLLEKSIHALALLGHLAESGLDFLFKGGTSLLLHLNPIRRLSIDIDIVCGASRRNLKTVLNEISKKLPFHRYEEDQRGDRGLPHRRHFKFYFQSIDPKFYGPFVLLDIVEEARCPHLKQKLPITAPFIEVEGETLVTLPTVESLLGDKLTAFAPTTVGVPLRLEDGKPGDPMQIAKQMFDIGELFNVAEDFATVQSVYDAVFALEAEYRSHRFTRDAALRDTLAASLALSTETLKGDVPNADTQFLRDGWRRLSSHLVQSKFGLNQVRIASAKSALLATALLAPPKGFSLEAIRYTGAPPQIEALRTASISSGPWQFANRIKAANPEAFHFWHEAHQIARVFPDGTLKQTT